MIENKLYDELCSEFFPVFKKMLASSKYAITLGGSHGKGIADINSDFDFRIYYEKCVDEETFQNVFSEVGELVAKWKERGIEVDGVWPRKIGQIDTELDKWCKGLGVLVPYEWNIWGYNILTDIYNQQIVEDPFLIAQGWRDKLSVYPKELENAIINKYCSSIQYWRNDYHYINKVNRKDTVFLASISTRLVNDIMQIIYSLNHFYFPGDGMNLKYTKDFKIKPINLEERVISALYPKHCEDMYKNQYNTIISIIDDILKLIAEI